MKPDRFAAPSFVYQPTYEYFSPLKLVGEFLLWAPMLAMGGAAIALGLLVITT